MYYIIYIYICQRILSVTVNFLGKINTGDIMKDKNKKDKDIQIEIAVNHIASQPETVYELINKYGTYQIQPTAESDNDFPKIAQGFPKSENRKTKDKD